MSTESMYAEELRKRGFVKADEHIYETGPYPPLPFYYRSDNPEFSQAVDEEGWRWIGPCVTLEDIGFKEILEPARLFIVH